MSRHLSKRPRGQGTVELALCSLLFVTILLAGIQFAEVGFLSLKVQEASNFALWTTTAKRVHFTNDMSESNDALGDVLGDSVGSAASVTQARFRDFNANPGGDGTITQTLVRGSALNVSCQRAPAVNFAVNAQPRGLIETIYAVDEGGAKCRASASLKSIRNPNSFAQQAEGGFFDEANNRFEGLFTVCALGRANGGDCPGAYPILLGEWALTGNAEGARIDFDQRTDNTVYFDATREVYARMGGGAGGAAEYANRFAGGTPGPLGFHMSYVPYDSLQSRPAAHGMRGEFNTSGVPDGRDGTDLTPMRSGCFLGVPGC